MQTFLLGFVGICFLAVFAVALGFIKAVRLLEQYDDSEEVFEFENDV